MDVYDKEKEGQLTGAHDDLGVSDGQREAENAAPEDQFASSPNSLSPDDIEAAEDSGATPGKTLPDSSEGDAVGTNNPLGGGGLYKPDADGGGAAGDGRSIKSLILNKKTGAGGGIIGLLVGGAFGISTISTGPPQFIHLSQLMQRFHFSRNESAGNSRILKLYKYAKNFKNGTQERNQLGIIGNRLADKQDLRYAKIGVKKDFVGGVFKGHLIDPAKYVENAQDGAAFDKDPQKFKEKFKLEHGIDLTVEGNHLRAPPSSGMFSNYFKNAKLNIYLSKQSGLNNISSSLAARTAGKRERWTWHPISKADAWIRAKSIEQAKLFFTAMKDRIRQGKSTPLSAQGAPGAPDANGNPNPAQTAQNAQGATDTTAAAVVPTDTTLGSGDVPAADIKLKFSDTKVGKPLIKAGGFALGAASAAGLVCAVQGITKAAVTLRHEQVIQPLVRTAMQGIAVGNEAMNNDLDLNLNSMGVFAKQLYSTENGSWTSARSIQKELHQPGTGPDIGDEASLSKLANGGAFAGFLNSFPGLGATCKVLGNSVVSGVMTIASFATPISTGITLAITSSPAFKDAIAGIVKWFAGSPISVAVFGSTYGNYVNYGARYAADKIAVSQGGIQLTKPQAQQLKAFENSIHQQEIDQKSFAQRIFDPYSPDSVVGKAIDSMSPRPIENVASAFGKLANPLKTLSILKLPFTAKVSAQSADAPVDYGADQMGNSVEELDNPKYADPYDNEKKVQAIMETKDGKEYREKALACFGIIIDEEAVISSDLTKAIDNTSDEYKSLECYTDENLDAWTRVRVHIGNVKAAEAADCYENNVIASCNDSGFGKGDGPGSAPPAPAASGTNQNSIDYPNIGKSSDTIPCAPGTNLLGPVTTLYTGDLKSQPDPIKINLCQVPDLPGLGNNTTGAKINGGITVNSRVSAAWQALATKAKADKVSLSADSSFRLADSCGGVVGNPLCAAPGKSMHQLGIAVDFAVVHQKDPKYSSGDCSNRNTMKGNPMWDWLDQNAPAFGIKQFSLENWHWDSYVHPSRCANGPSAPAGGGTAMPVPPGSVGGSAPSGSVQDMAKQILANPNVTYPYDSVSANGSSKAVLQALAAGQAAPVTCRNSTYPGTPTTNINPNILQFIIESAQQGKVGVNALTDKCHSSSASNHYIGKAIDLQVGIGSLSVFDPVAAKYGGKKNGETSHHHYDFP